MQMNLSVQNIYIAHIHHSTLVTSSLEPLLGFCLQAEVAEGNLQNLLISKTTLQCYIYLFILLIRPALKVCGLPVPTARKVQVQTLYSVLHIVNYMIVSASCSD